MPRAQTNTQFEDDVLPRTLVADSKAAFIVGFFEKGPTVLGPGGLGDLRCDSNAEVKAKFGNRIAASSASDAIETIFRMSGGALYPLRELGPTPVLASANVFDQSGSTNPGDIALVLHMRQYGDLFNAYDFEITASGGNFQILIYDGQIGSGGAVVETSPLLADRAAAVAWGLTSTYLSSITTGASNEDPRAQTGSFTGGTDDHSNATITEFGNALALSESLKGGLIAAPGQTTDAIRAALAAHGLTYFRKAILDFADTAVEADLVTDVADVTALDAANAADAYGPPITVQGVAAGAQVTVPASALIIGLYRRNDADDVSINQAAAGPQHGTAPDFVNGVTQTWTNAEQDTLADGLFNVIRTENGKVVVNGARTAADPDDRPQWSSAPGARTAFTVATEGDAVLDSYRFAPLINDTFIKLERDLIDVCAKYAAPPHKAFGDPVDNGDGTLDVGYSVDAGPTVNTAETKTAKQLKAKLTLRPAGFAEDIELTISQQQA